MTNKEYFESYASVAWALEQNLAMMISQYCEDSNIPHHMMKNPVTFVKKFMKQETYAEIDFAEKAKMEQLESSIIVDVNQMYPNTSPIIDVEEDDIRVVDVPSDNT